MRPSEVPLMTQEEREERGEQEEREERGSKMSEGFGMYGRSGAGRSSCVIRACGIADITWRAPCATWLLLRGGDTRPSADRGRAASDQAGRVLRRGSTPPRPLAVERGIPDPL